MTPRRRRHLVALVAPCALIVAACGDDDGGGGSAEDFCAIFESEPVEFSDDEDPSEAIALLNRLKDNAPAEIRDDMEIAVDGFSELAEIDFESIDPDDFAELEERFNAAGEAADRVEAWATDNCDLPEDFFGS